MRSLVFFLPILLSPVVAYAASFSRIEVRHLEPEGIGFDKGYTTLALFLTPHQERQSYPFADLRGHVFNDGTLAANLGGGVRVASDQWELVFGANAYYDYRHAEDMSIHQGAIGFEWLSPWYDLRFGGSYPFSGKTSLSDPSFSHFCGCDAFAGQMVKGALPMVEAEVRVPLYHEIDLSAGIGAYYLFSRQVENVHLGDALGGTARLLLRPTDGLMFEGGLSFDEIFHVRGNGLIRFSFPFGPGNMRTRGKRFRERFGSHSMARAQELARLTAPVWRSEIIPIENDKRCFPILCQNQKRERKMVFVRGNRLGEAGDGSFEHPFVSLNTAIATAGKEDIIYLLSGDESTLTESASLSPGQSLIGSSEKMVLKEIPVPALSPQLAKVRGRGSSPIVRLADNSIVHGIAFDGASLSTENAGNFAIHNCAFYGDKPTLFVNGQKKGKKEITDTLFSGDESSLFIAMSDGSELVLARNHFTGFSRAPIAFAGKEIKECKIGIQNNEFYDIDAPAIILPETMTRCFVSIDGNDFTQIGAETILLTGELRGGELQVKENSFSHLSSSALAIGSMVGSTVQFEGNRLSDVKRGVHLGFSPDAKATNGTLIFASNTLNNVEDSGIEISLSGESSSFSIENNEFEKCGSALAIRAGSDLNTSSFLLKNNCFTQISEEALSSASPLHKCEFSLTNNTFTDLARADVNLTADHTEVSLEGNTFCNEFAMHALGSSSLFLSSNSSPLYRLINEKGEDFFLQPPNPTEFTRTNTGMIQAIGENFLFTSSPRKPKAP